jgi:hypothetical protein
MQPLGQGSQRQWADAQMSEPFTHLSQAHSDASQVLDLSVHIIADALMSSNQPAKVDFHTPSAFAPHPRQSKGHLPPDRDEWITTTEAVPAEPSTPSRSAAAAFALSAQSLGYFYASNVVPAAH